MRAGSPGGHRARSARAGSELRVAVRASEAPEGALFAEGAAVALRRVAPPTARVLVGDCDGPEEVVAAVGERPVVAHDAKALGLVPPGLVHDTLLGAYLLEPARRGYPFAELCEERGLASDLEDPLGGRRACCSARSPTGSASRSPSAAWSAVMQRDRAAAGGGAARDGAARGAAEPRAPGRDHRRACARRSLALEAEIFALAGEEFLIASPQQLGEILFEKLGLSRKRRGKTGFSTDARVLQAIRSEHEIVPKIERWRELSTLAKTYLDVLPELVDERSRIHTTFLQAVAQTGRLVEHQPEHAERPDPHPARARDPRLLRGRAGQRADLRRLLADRAARARPRGRRARAEGDLRARRGRAHRDRLAGLRGRSPTEIDPGMRSKAKMINYGIVYGLSDFGLADRLNIPREEAKEFIDAYLERFPRVAAFMAETIEQAKEQGYVTTLWGRRRQIPELRARNYQVRTLGERLAVNTVIQGTAADIIKLAMVRCHAALAESGLQHAPDADDPRRAAVRRPARRRRTRRAR